MSTLRDDPVRTSSAGLAGTPAAEDKALLSRRPFIALMSGIAAIGGLLFGYDTAVISGAILFVRQQFQLSPLQMEIAVSMVLAGALAGAASGGYLGDRWGRRRTLLIIAAMYGLFALTTGLAQGPWPFAISRLLVGYAVGVSSMLSPLYIAELAPERMRGALVTLNQMAISAGVVIAYYVDYLLAPSGNWRWMFMSAVIPSAVLLVGLLYLPETPRWLAAHGRFEESAAILAKVQDPAEAARDLEQLHLVTEHDDLRLRDLFARRFHRPLMVGIGLALFQQITGVNTIVYYAPTIFESVGFMTAAHAILATFLIGAVGLSATVVSILLIDRIGRRPLLLIGTLTMAAALACLGWLLGNPHPVMWQIVLDILIYIAAFDIGLGPVSWLLISELYPTTVRAQAMSLATVTIWGGDLLVTATFLTLTGHLGMRGSFLLFAALSVAAFFFSMRFVPETRGRTLEQIEESWMAVSVVGKS